jgi:hypothetical protein
MKKLMRLFAFFFAVTAVMAVQSCKEDEEIGAAPTVEVDPTSAQNIPGGDVTAALTVVAP